MFGPMVPDITQVILSYLIISRRIVTLAILVRLPMHAPRTVNNFGSALHKGVASHSRTKQNRRFSDMTSRNSSHRGADYGSRVFNPSIQGLWAVAWLPWACRSPVSPLHGGCILFCHSLSASSPRPSESQPPFPTCKAHPTPCIPLDAQNNKTTRAPAGTALHVLCEMINQDCAHG